MEMSYHWMKRLHYWMKRSQYWMKRLHYLIIKGLCCLCIQYRSMIIFIKFGNFNQEDEKAIFITCQLQIAKKCSILHELEAESKKQSFPHEKKLSKNPIFQGVFQAKRKRHINSFYRKQNLKRSFKHANKYTHLCQLDVNFKYKIDS